MKKINQQNVLIFLDFIFLVLIQIQQDVNNNVQINQQLHLKRKARQIQMNKRKYVIKKEDLFKSIDNIVYQQDYQTNRTLFINQIQFEGKRTPREFVIENDYDSKENQDPCLNPSSSRHQQRKQVNKKSKQKNTSKSKSKQKVISVLKPNINNKQTVKKTNLSINFSSSLKTNYQNKTLKFYEKKSNKSKSKQKQVKSTLNNSLKEVKKYNYNYSHHQNIFSKDVQNEFLKDKQNEFLKDKQNEFLKDKQNNCSQVKQQQKSYCKIEEVETPTKTQSDNLHQQKDKKIANYQQYDFNKQIQVKNQQNLLVDKSTQVQQNIKNQKQIKDLISNQYLTQIQLRLNFLQNQLNHKQVKIKELLIIIETKQKKINEKQKQTIHLYNQNQQLSEMLRDLQKIIENTTIQNRKFILQTENKFKQKQNQYKILQAERDTLLRKKDRLNQQISKLNETITAKDTQILQYKQKQQLLIKENNQIIEAYEKMKSQLEQALKINQTQKFFKQLVEKTEQQTARSSFQVQSFRCEKCNQVIYGNQTTMDDLAKYHMNQKFKKHIQTYEDQVKYWKDEVQFMKTQHQHQIQNIRTILQCTYQKNLFDKQTKWYQQIQELKQKIDIQQQLIQNYKNILEKKTQTTKKLFNKIQMTHDKSPLKIDQTSKNIQNTSRKNAFDDQKNSPSKINSQIKNYSARYSYCSNLPKNSQFIDLELTQLPNEHGHSRLFSKDYQ